MMDGFDTIPIPDTEHTGDTDSAGDPGPSQPPFGPEPRERTRELAAMERQLTDLYSQVGIYGGMVAGQTGNLAGAVLTRNAPHLASAWIDLAEKDSNVRATIRKILQSGGWAGVLGAHVFTFLPILALAGVLPQPFAQRVFMGLAVSDPELYTWLAAQTGNAPTPQGNGVG